MNTIISRINELPGKSIIFISGFGGSGKSTLAMQLGDKLDIPVISIDDFYLDMEDYHHWSCFDYEKLISTVIKPFKRNKFIKYNAYNWEDPTTPLLIKVPLSKTVIIEGVGIFSDNLIKYASLSIWIDCSLEESIRRGKNRDNNIYKVDNDYLWDGIWKRNDTECFNEYNPLYKADIIYTCNK